MVQLSPEDVQNQEILHSKGLILYHCQLSSSSQKVRMYLRLKGLPYEARHIDILHNEHLEPEYLSINPRGLVPLLVHDGNVVIESNDIMLYLEETFPNPPLLPPNIDMSRLVSLLDQENDLHFTLRKLSFRFLFNPPRPVKSEEILQRYATLGAGTLQGQPDNWKEKEIEFWRQYNSTGLPDHEARYLTSTVIRPQFDKLDTKLADQPYLLSATLSILDLAWFPFVNRFNDARYPLAELHPNLYAWWKRMMTDPIVAEEVDLPPPVRAMVDQTQAKWKVEEKSMIHVCFPELLGDRPM